MSDIKREKTKCESQLKQWDDGVRDFDKAVEKHITGVVAPQV